MGDCHPGQTVTLVLVLLVGLVFMAPRPAQAGDLGRAALAVAAGALVYELLDDDWDCYGPRYHPYYRDRGCYRDWGGGFDLRMYDGRRRRAWEGGFALRVPPPPPPRGRGPHGGWDGPYREGPRWGSEGRYRDWDGHGFLLRPGPGWRH